MPTSGIRRDLMAKRTAPKAEMRKLAHERIEILWGQALSVATTRPELARRWMNIAKALGRRTRVKIPRHISRRLCKECGSVLIPGQTSRVRLRHNRSTHVSVTCLNCGAIRRFPVGQEP
ncbi:MAG: ribonuclease P [Candidatus Thorarchaeota archaeon]|nr:MAG: ribonuclease P [Candidatus Thorarchaeota archaeon]